MLKKNTKFSTLRGLASVGVVSACSVGVSQAAITVNILENGSDIVMSVSGSVTGVSHLGTYYTGAGYRWISSLGALSDMIHTGDTNTESHRYSVSDKTDTGVLGASGSIGGGLLENVTGAVHSVGGYNDPGQILLGSGYTSGTVLGYDIRFTSSDYSTFGLSAGDSRTITFDDGAGGQDSISWTVGSVPEPSSALLASFGLCLLAFRRKRI